MSQRCQLTSNYLAQANNKYETRRLDELAGNQLAPSGTLTADEIIDRTNEDENCDTRNRLANVTPFATHSHQQDNDVADDSLPKARRAARDVCHGFGKRKNLFCYILFATNLIMSILNTILLSFIIKTTQLNDGSIFNGKLNWLASERTLSSELAIASAVGKSISLNSIESASKRPLRIDGLEQPHGSKRKLSIVVAGRRSNGHPKGEPEDLNAGASRIDIVGGVTDDKLAVNTNRNGRQTQHLHSTGREQTKTPVRIYAKSFELNLIDDMRATKQLADDIGLGNSYQIAAAAASPNKTDSISISNYRRRPVSMASGERRQQLRQLLQFNGSQNCISLTMIDGDKLDLGPSAGSLLVGDQLTSGSELVGTMGEDLDLQTRGGNLSCVGKQALRLISRSADLHLVAGETLVLDAPLLNLSIPTPGKRLILEHGINYLDQAGALPDAMSADKKLSSRRPLWAGEEAENKADNDADQVTTSWRAYNLVLVDGLLMADALD